MRNLTTSADIHENERVQKASTYLATKLGPHYNIFNVIDARAHRIKRRLIGSVLSERSMRVFEPTMTEQINVFIKQLLTPARASMPVNVSQRVKFMALDIVGLLAFGYQLKLQTSSKNRHMIGSLKGGNHRLNTYMQYPLLAKLHLEVVVYVLMLMKKESYLRLLESMIASRLKEEKHAKYDLYSVVIDAMQASPGDNITVAEIWSEALFFFPAGKALRLNNFHVLTPSTLIQLDSKIHLTLFCGIRRRIRHDRDQWSIVLLVTQQAELRDSSAGDSLHV